VAPGVFGGERIRLFRRSIDGPAWADHLRARSLPVPTLEVGVPSEVTVETLAGPLAVGLLLVQEAPAGAPLIVTHHGNNERAFDLGRRAKNFLNRALLAHDRPDATLVLLRAPFHEDSLRAYTEAAGELTTWMSMLAASVCGAGSQDLPVLFGDVQDFRMVGHAGSIHPEDPTGIELTRRTLAGRGATRLLDRDLPEPSIVGGRPEDRVSVDTPSDHRIGH
jgi:hypothetical protein